MLKSIAFPTLAVAAVLLAGCAAPAYVEPAASPTSPELLTLDEAKDIAQQHLVELLDVVPAGSIVGQPEIPETSQRLEPCRLGGPDDEWRWTGQTEFELTAEGTVLSTVELYESITADGSWTPNDEPDEIEQNDPIWATHTDSTYAVLWLRDSSTGIVSAISPCFALPGGWVEGDTY